VLGIRVPVRTMGAYLKCWWGFTPQKPIRRADGQSPTAVKHWLETDYPAMAAQAKKEGAEIYWGDATGLRSDDVRGRGFAPKGEPGGSVPIASATARRSSRPLSIRDECAGRSSMARSMRTS